MELNRVQGTVKQDSKRNEPGYLGPMRARVTAANDPWKIGRVRVRIPSLHGVPGLSQYLKNDECPWACPVFAGGAFEEGGQFLVPIVGSWVLVIFEDNDPNKLLYLGGIPTTGKTKQPRTMGNPVDEENRVIPWQTDQKTRDIPNDVWQYIPEVVKVPEKDIVWKSVKGHTILMDNRDYNEEMAFIDRAGSIIAFKCACKIPGHDQPRRLRRADDETNPTIPNYDVPDPYILGKVGPTEDNSLTDYWEQHQGRYWHHVVDLSNPDEDFSSEEKTTQLIDFNTYKTQIYMDHNRIEFDYKWDKPENGGSKMHKVVMNNVYYFHQTFDDSYDLFTREYIHRVYKEAEIYMDNNEIKLAFPNVSVTLYHSTGDVEVKCNNFRVEASGAAHIDAKEEARIKANDSLIAAGQGETLMDAGIINLNPGGPGTSSMYTDPDDNKPYGDGSPRPTMINGNGNSIGGGGTLAGSPGSSTGNGNISTGGGVSSGSTGSGDKNLNSSIKPDGTTVGASNQPITVGKSQYDAGAKAAGMWDKDDSRIEEIEIPDGLGNVFTHMAWQMITGVSKQLTLKKIAGQNFDRKGIGIVEGMYTVATTPKFGDIGQYLEVTLSNGETFRAVIADFKNTKDKGCTEWGHQGGHVVVEFVVSQVAGFIGYNGRKSIAGKEAPVFPSWRGQRVVKIKKIGKYPRNLG